MTCFHGHALPSSLSSVEAGPTTMRVLVIDDSTLFRKVVRDVIHGIDGFEVVGVAGNGRIAIEKVRDLRPDLITLDVEMPELDGLGVLRELRSMTDPPGVIMVSGTTSSNAVKTTEALELGAFDFILKPSGNSLSENTAALRQNLEPKLAGYASARRQRKPAVELVTQPPIRFCPADRRPPQVCLIGVSTGGPAALAKLLPEISSDFPLPIVIVQHMPELFTRKLADSLDPLCSLKVCELQDGMLVRPGKIYIAPGGKQTRIESGMPFPVFKVNDDPPEKHCKPSVDYLFRSASKVYRGRALGVILTGMGDDGLEGCRLLVDAGASIVAQDEASSVVYGMPKCVVNAGLASSVVPLRKMADTIESFVGGKVPC